jgi:hypothetical protein
MKRLIGLAVVALIGGGFWAQFGAGPDPIDSYRLIDDDTIAIMTTTSDLTWTRVTSVHETETRVEITVRSVTVPLPMASVAYPLELTVDLREPLGDRQVMDGFDDSPPRR